MYYSILQNAAAPLSSTKQASRLGGAGRRRPSAGRHRWMPPRRRLDAEKRRSYDAAAVAPLFGASRMPATPSNVHTLTGMRLCGAAAAASKPTKSRRRQTALF